MVAAFAVPAEPMAVACGLAALADRRGDAGAQELPGGVYPGVSPSMLVAASADVVLAAAYRLRPAEAEGRRRAGYLVFGGVTLLAAPSSPSRPCPRSRPSDWWPSSSVEWESTA
jgi:hypothetical protein